MDMPCAARLFNFHPIAAAQLGDAGLAPKSRRLLSFFNRSAVNIWGIPI